MEFDYFDGPYFLGQKSEKCGHYYPDVLLFQDSLIENKLYRTLFCFKCNRAFQQEISSEIIDSSLLEKLKEEKEICYGTLSQLRNIRKEKLKNMIPKSDW